MLRTTKLTTLNETGELKWDDPQLDAQTQNWLFLRQITIPWMEAHPERVSFNDYYAVESCGTYACLGGWYAALRYPTEFRDADEDAALETAIEHVLADLLTAEDEWRSDDPIFGMSSMGTLADRTARVDAIIAERLAMLDAVAERKKPLTPPA